MPELKLNRQKLLDKLGERWLFEKKSVFLYDKIIRKLQSLKFDGEVTQLRQFRGQELEHQKSLEGFITQLGSNVRRKTPSQRVVEIEAQAFDNIISSSDDPSQLLHVLLDAEMEDNASWELLMQLARGARQNDFVKTFETCLDAERRHLRTVRTMITRLARRELVEGARTNV